MTHPIHSSNPDTACRWLCLTAGQRTKQDETEINAALQNLPFQGGALSLLNSRLGHVDLEKIWALGDSERKPR